MTGAWTTTTRSCDPTSRAAPPPTRLCAAPSGRPPQEWRSNRLRLRRPVPALRPTAPPIHPPRRPPPTAAIPPRCASAPGPRQTAPEPLSERRRAVYGRVPPQSPGARQNRCMCRARDPQTGEPGRRCAMSDGPLPDDPAERERLLELRRARKRERVARMRARHAAHTVHTCKIPVHAKLDALNRAFAGVRRGWQRRGVPSQYIQGSEFQCRFAMSGVVTADSV